MARSQSPGYPSISLAKAIGRIRAIHAADRRNPIDREVAAKHMGYSGSSGASDKVLSSLAHYGLLEKAGKGQTRVSDLAVDILHPDTKEGQKKALLEAAYSPNIFSDIRERFTDGHPSEQALRSWLTRESFLDRAIGPVVEAYMENCRYLEQEGAFESHGPSVTEGGESKSPNSDDDVDDVDQRRFGGASLGDLVQWESSGTLRLDAPKRVRFVSEDGNWIAVEGSNTGIPMNEVIVQEKGTAIKPPVIPTEKPVAETKAEKGTRREVFALDEGDVVLSFPENLSSASYDDLEAYLNVFLRKAKRRADLHKMMLEDAGKGLIDE